MKMLDGLWAVRRSPKKKFQYKLVQCSLRTQRFNWIKYTDWLLYMGMQQLGNYKLHHISLYKVIPIELLSEI